MILSTLRPERSYIASSFFSSVAVPIPVVAIGGIDRQNIASLAGTGVAGAAVVSGIFASQDIEAECRFLRAVCDRVAGG